jgi:nitrite reductase (NO-forming)
VVIAAREFKFSRLRLIVDEGVVVLRLVNRGKVRHDLRVAGKRTPRLRPGRSASLRLGNLAPGTYRFLCTVPGHAAAGMRGSLVVRAVAPAETTE